jgi:hypothetical protein
MRLRHLAVPAAHLDGVALDSDFTPVGVKQPHTLRAARRREPGGPRRIQPPPFTSSEEHTVIAVDRERARDQCLVCRTAAPSVGRQIDRLLRRCGAHGRCRRIARRPVPRTRPRELRGQATREADARRSQACNLGRRPIPTGSLHPSSIGAPSQGSTLHRGETPQEARGTAEPHAVDNHAPIHDVVAGSRRTVSGGRRRDLTRGRPGGPQDIRSTGESEWPSLLAQQRFSAP